VLHTQNEFYPEDTASKTLALENSKVRESSKLFSVVIDSIRKSWGAKLAATSASCLQKRIILEPISVCDGLLENGLVCWIVSL
jgi:hypothetical protein